MSRVVVAADVAWVEAEDVVYAARLPDGPPLVLEGPGAVVWHALLPGGTVDEVAERVAQRVGVSAEAVLLDVAGFLDGLLRAGVAAQE
ncbi:PqqD family protein [Phycicoccus avicenniae]|uniref:PqqD family protein n=1 Tax=Phycicoccus avicenniae TaxID=2828860 RepID=UPI003D2E0E85